MKIELNDYKNHGFGIWLEPETVEDVAKLQRMVRCSKNRVEFSIHGSMTTVVTIGRNRRKSEYFTKVIGGGK